MLDQKISLNDGHVMPRLGYGVWQLGNDEAERLVGQGIEAGFRHVDTAQAYFNEAGVGRAVRAARIDRGELFVTSKLRGRDMGYDRAKRSLDESLQRLGLDYLDLFLIHWPMPAHDLYVETWQALIELQASGLVRSIGVSNFTQSHIERIVKETGIVPAVNQIELHLFYQQRAALEFHQGEGIVIECYSPFGSSGAAVLRQEAVRTVAAKHGRTPAQIVLRWHLQQGLVPLPKTAKASRLVENLAVWDFELDGEDMTWLSELDRARGNTQPHPDGMNSTF